MSSNVSSNMSSSSSSSGSSSSSSSGSSSSSSTSSRMANLLLKACCSVWRGIAYVHTRLEEALLGPEVPQNPTRDAIMEVVDQSPQDALVFIKIVMLFGTISGVLISAPTVAYLYLNWSHCDCNKALQWWNTIFTALQIPQLPVRYLFFCHLCTCGGERREIVDMVYEDSIGNRTMESHRQIVSAISVSLLRLVATFVSFWISLPPSDEGRGAAAAAAAVAAARAAPITTRWRRGAYPHEIDALPTMKYKEKLEQILDQQRYNERQQQRQQQRLQQKQQHLQQRHARRIRNEIGLTKEEKEDLQKELEEDQQRLQQQDKQDQEEKQRKRNMYVKKTL
ncbi:zinc finger (C3HC4 RING finger) protein, putative [Eimeria maxima]|uniref:Zinc finger (C3HC4 RING finger) protein, putative n=1 Tax=Eimeria maxima TaxID=5804 RepID=U6M9J2_EIMMA|nr:zinc finger (C3HC4 RING finger) protein, putative [Eimeria maxima]CDJ60686.1 zinc finger (C3HC4 RING finger) protein, putative [Eimeria maxima]